MKNINKKSFQQFFIEVFSEQGIGSSKRIVGSITLLVVLGCIIYLTITGGCTNCVENLLQTSIIAACSLLGVSSITSIWKNNNKSNKS